MKAKIPCLFLALALFAGVNRAVAQGTAFTYQGQLYDGTNLANGLYDIRGGLYITNSGGSLVTPLYTNTAVPVSNGLFIITFDFGDIFTGSNYWLQIGVRTNGAGASFTPMSGRQQVTPTPYAIFAEDANTVTGVLPSTSLTGNYSSPVFFLNTNNTFDGNGAGLTGVNAATLGGVAATGFWKTTGNAGTSPLSNNYVGTTDFNPLELHVNTVRAFRLEPNMNDANHLNLVNVVGGSPANFASPGVYGATISGGVSS